MARVRVVTDTTGYLPVELVESLDITLVSLHYELNGEPAREIDAAGRFADFYDRLEASGGMASTSPPAVTEFSEIYEGLLNQGSSVVSVHISSGLSDTCLHARRAAEQMDAERVTVIDSASTAGQLGLYVLAAARAAAADQPHAEVVERVRRARQEAKVWFLLDTLEYLKRGGRVGTAAAWIGSALDVKPILTLESEATAVERVRTRARGIDRLIHHATQHRALGADAWVVQHCRAADDAKQLTDRLQHVFDRPPEFVSEVGPVVGTHTGPGLLGCGGVASRLLE